MASYAFDGEIPQGNLAGNIDPQDPLSTKRNLLSKGGIVGQPDEFIRHGGHGCGPSEGLLWIGRWMRLPPAYKTEVSVGGDRGSNAAGSEPYGTGV